MSTELPQLVLASASPRRKGLLELIGVKFEVFSPDVDESVQNGETPHDLACRLAHSKATAAATKFPDRVILAADTVVAFAQDSNSRWCILGKPESSSDAERMLGILQGREHIVITGFCVLHGEKAFSKVRFVETTVRFRALTQTEIAAYVATGEPMDKAGAYGAQGIGQMCIHSISGSYSNVVGLPLVETMEELSTLGLWTPALLASTSISSAR